MLATVVEKPFEPQPAGNTLHGISAGTMGADHPVLWCKDYQGGRSFYSALGTTQSAFGESDFRQMLKGAIDWTAGVADPVTSDCGATVWANYQQVKVSGNTPAPRNLLEPIGFDQLPDGRLIQTARTGQVRLHNPATGTTQILANFADPALPTTMRIYTNSEDGLYGPAVDNNFAQNHWVYLYYAPQTVTDVKLSDGSVVTQTTPNRRRPELRVDRRRRGIRTWATSSSRASSSSRTRTARAWTSAPSSRSCGSPTTARSAATSRATSTSTSTTTCGWSRVTTRPPAASAPTATARSRTS